MIIVIIVSVMPQREEVVMILKALSATVDTDISFMTYVQTGEIKLIFLNTYHVCLERLYLKKTLYSYTDLFCCPFFIFIKKLDSLKVSIF